MRARITPRLRSLLQRRPVQRAVCTTTTVLIVLYNGDDEVYRLETPVEVSPNPPYGDGAIAVGSHFRNFGQSITFDRIEVQPRHRYRHA